MARWPTLAVSTNSSILRKPTLSAGLSSASRNASVYRTFHNLNWELAPLHWPGARCHCCDGRLIAARKNHHVLWTSCSTGWCGTDSHSRYHATCAHLLVSGNLASVWFKSDSPITWSARSSISCPGTWRPLSKPMLPKALRYTHQVSTKNKRTPDATFCLSSRWSGIDPSILAIEVGKGLKRRKQPKSVVAELMRSAEVTHRA